MKLPSAVKQRMEAKYGADLQYFVTSQTGDIVLIYALSEWERIEDTLAQASQFDTSKRKFLFWANHFGAEVGLDAQERLLIPAKLRDQAGMKGEVMLAWQSNHIEVMSQARYEAEIEQNRLLTEDFETLKKLGV